MQIIFTETFTETCEGEFQISRKQVSETINTPTVKQIEEFENLKLGFFVKKEDQVMDGTLLLVCTRIMNDQWIVDLSFRIHSDLFEDSDQLEPLELFQRFAELYGCEIRIGTLCSKFIFRKSIPIDECEIYKNELLKVVELPPQGLIYPIMKVNEQDDGLFVECAIAFCIDTRKYVSSFFGWKDCLPTQVKLYSLEQSEANSAFCLTNGEKNTIREFTRDVFPEEKSSQTDAAKLHGAYIILRKVLGETWCQANINPNIDSDITFLKRQMSDPLDRMLYVYRLVTLAESLYTLKDVFGITTHVKKIEGKNLESLWFEYFVPYLIHEAGHQVIEFAPESSKEKRPDLIVKFREQLIPVEIKAKQEDTPYSRRKLLNLLNKGFKQLPVTGPGTIFLMIHPHWLQDKNFIQNAEAIINSALLRHRNCNAIFVYWPRNEISSTGEYTYQWRFRHFITRHPMVTIPKIGDLVTKREMELKPMSVTYLE